MSAPSAAVRPLAGRRVVDLSTWIAGAYCARLLADASALVTRVPPVGGHPLASWSASVAMGEGSGSAGGSVGGSAGGSVGALDRHLSSGIPTAEVDRLGSLLDEADVVIWSPGGWSDPASIVRDHAGATVVSITPFGLDTPWSDRPATEFTLQAWSGGMIGLGRGDPERAPVHVGGQVTEWLSGAFAAVGLMAALRMGAGCMGAGRPTAGQAGAGRAEVGRLVDVSMLEVAAMCLTYYPVTFHDSFGRPMRKRRALTVPGVSEASDGPVGLGVGTGQQWLDFCVMVGHPEWAEDVSLFSERGALAREIDRWVGEQTIADVLDVATAFRIPNAPIVNGANAGDPEHFQARGMFAANEHGGGARPGVGDDGTDDDLRVGPRPPIRITSSPPTGSVVQEPSPGVGSATQNGFEGLRVLDMTAYWAGPSASHVLAMLGAEVVHLESGRRPDGARLVGGRSTKVDRYWEQGPIFAALNTDKSSLALDFSKPEGLDLLRRFIATCDLVIENYTPRVLDSLGLDGDGLRAIRDDLIVVRMPGFGLDGPWRDQPAFAFVIEDASGLTWMTGHPDQHPVEPYCVGDSNAGIHAAYGTMLALAHRDATGLGCQVEVAMVDAALSIAAEQVVEHRANGALLARAGNRGPVATPQNTYDCEGTDEFGHEPNRVAIAVATDEQWAALRGVLGDPEWASDAAMAIAAGRRAQHDRIDNELAAWCATRSAGEVVTLLLAAGVPAAVVSQPHRQPDLEPLQVRGFFESLEHPVMGPARYSTLPFRFDGMPATLHRRPAPLLGEHSEALLVEIGVDRSEYDELVATGVVATTLEGA